MLKFDSSSSIHSLKCGEVFCISPEVFNVSCLLCPCKMHFDQFPIHFQLEHLTPAEESINLKDVSRRTRKKLAASILDNTSIKDEVDPIKQEDCDNLNLETEEEQVLVATDIEQDDDDKCLQQLINENGKSKIKKEAVDGLLKNIVDEINMPRTPLSKSTNNDNSDKTALKMVLDMKENDSNDSEGYSDTDVVNLSKNDISRNEDNGDEDKDLSENEDNKDTDSNSETERNIEDELPYPCLDCKRSYRTKHGLQKHNYRVHNPNKPVRRRQNKPKHKCDECNEVFRSARDLGGHKWKHTGIVCDICGKAFTQTGNMIRHKIRHTGIKAHKCNECSKDFFTAKELKSHMICHTGLMPLICEICGKRCRDRGVLTAHMRRHTGERPAKCDVCEKSFFSFHDLNVHAVTHTTERPFKCDICGSTFQRKKALRVHKLIHSKDRKHVCKICGKGFAQSGGLNSHMRTHDAAVQRTESVNIPTGLLENPITHVGHQTSAASATTEFVEQVQILGGYVV